MRLRNILVLLVILAALTGAFYLFGRPAPPPAPQPREYVWLVELDDITHVGIGLPRENASQKFIKIVQDDKFPWFFDDANRSPVDTVRWGGGIPLLLSGPGADRKVTDNATQEQLAEFGLAQPQMEIVMTLKEGRTLSITVGDQTPDGNRHYVRAPNTNVVATVDGSWFEVLAGLVRNPPYATAR
ncbi:MAG: DUF4340 domain-containing protein [Chloroflexi bacterium]|nr:DUF4340 domain-containing protein [Chloroflexota bacterium]